MFYKSLLIFGCLVVCSFTSGYASAELDAQVGAMPVYRACRAQCDRVWAERSVYSNMVDRDWQKKRGNDIQENKERCKERDKCGMQCYLLAMQVLHKLEDEKKFESDSNG
ncbi:MAG: hypothetical protein P4L31_07215 [Candidatus Babeliales bacterium]|nr:hypothetical protein [Candidatus Babeliales bacterium]